MDNKIFEIINSFDAVSGIVVERSDGKRLINHNSDYRFPSASIIKLYIMWALYKKINDGELNETDLIDVTSEPVVGGCGILQQLKTENLTLTLRDICTLMIVLSDNMATNIIIRKVGLDYINQQIQSLGLSKTSLQRMLMDSEARKRGLDNYTSPEDSISILKAILFDDSISRDLRSSMLEILNGQILTNHVAHNLPLDYKFAHKTGNLAATLHDVGILYTPNDFYYISVMLDEITNIVEGKKVINSIGESIFTMIREVENKE